MDVKFYLIYFGKYVLARYISFTDKFSGMCAMSVSTFVLAKRIR